MNPEDLRVNAEEFNKLNQLDRIEFRLRYKELKEDKPKLFLIEFFYPMIMVVCFVLLLSLLMYNINQDSTYKLLNLIPIMIKLWIIASVALLVLYFMLIRLWKKSVEKLEEEYFKFKTEVKNVKRKR